MTSIVTQSLLGQSPEGVQAVLGPVQHHQPNPDNQTALYVYGPGYLQGVFPVQITGIIGIFRNHQCIALKIVFSKVDPRYSSFIYNRAIACRLFERVISHDYAYWHEVEAEPRPNHTIHYVYCMGHRTATTWDALAEDGTLTSDVSIFLDNRCGPTDNPELTQPIVAVPTTSTAGQGLIRQPPRGAARGGLGSTKPIALLQFSDISGHLYEKEILKAANTYHVMAGYPDGTFRPTLVITREQGLGMLIKAMQSMVVDAGTLVMPDEIIEAPFADVPAHHKSAQQFYLAKQVGILTGDQDQKAHPQAPMTRAEWVAMVHNGLAVVVEANYSPTTTLGEVIEPIPTGVTFTDVAGHWAGEVIGKMGTYGLATRLNETGRQFAPDTQAQRDFTAAVLVRMMELKFRTQPGGETRPMPVRVFPDIGHDLYKEAIVRAANQYNIVAGHGDHKFHPTDGLSREQAVAMLLNAMQVMVNEPETIQIPETLGEPPPFPDVKAGGNATKIQFAKAAGLISGDKEGNFRPMDTLSRAQLMAMISQGLEFVVKANSGQDIPLFQAIQPPEKPLSPFTDVPPDHWGSALMSTLIQAGIATPYNEAGTEFKPDQPCQRNFAAAAMVRMVETKFIPEIAAKPSQPNGFSDLKGNPFEAEILLAAQPYRLVSGYEDGTFKPLSPTTREQAVAMIVDALGQKVTNKKAISVPDHLAQPPFKDVDINRWSATRLFFAKQAGIVSGDDQGRFNPESPLSRAQLMAITYQALKYAIWADFGKTDGSIEAWVIKDPAKTYAFDDIPSGHWGVTLIKPLGEIGLALPLQVSAPTQFSPDTIAFRDYTTATAVNLIRARYVDQPSPSQSVTVVDIASSPYQAEILKAVNQYHVVSVNQNGTFRPAESIRRDHLVAMVVEAIKQRVSDPSVITMSDPVLQAPFEDVPAESLFAAKIKFVTDVGIMNGDQGTRLFRPQNDLTRAELMTVMTNALAFVVQQNYGESVTLAQVVVPQQKAPVFPDIDGHWAQANIEQMAKLGLALPLTSDSSQFLPDRPARRDFAAASVVHLIEVPISAPDVPKEAMALEA